MLTILAIVAAAALLVTFWKYILKFLNAHVRNLLESLFGADECGWFVKLVTWLDDKIVPIRRFVKAYWKKFKDTVLSVKSTYAKTNDGSYTKTTETIVRSSPTSAKRVVVEETVGWEYLPDAVRHEMFKRKVDVAECDDRVLIEEKFRQRAAKEAIVLSA